MYIIPTCLCVPEGGCTSTRASTYIHTHIYVYIVRASEEGHT